MLSPFVIQKETISQAAKAFSPEQQSLPAINHLTIKQFNNRTIQQSTANWYLPV
jgi:hypothetical protein